MRRDKNTTKRETRRSEARTDARNGAVRLIVTFILILAQIGYLLLIYSRLYQYYTWISLATSALAIVFVLYVYGKPTNAASRMLWIIVMLLFPLLGVLLYLLFGRQDATRHLKKKFRRAQALLASIPLAPGGPPDDPVAHYLQAEGFPSTKDGGLTYYADASLALASQVEALKHATSFIFMEYHAIEDKESFALLKEVLAAKAKEGVTVRIIYDDLGSIFFINRSFKTEMERLGIACRAFNPFLPVLSIFMNNRDHRKITVIDGKTSFTGGYNLANEYFNVTHPYGHWKDVGVRIEGDATASFTRMFLEMWNAIKMTDEAPSLARFFPATTFAGDATLTPYADSPLDCAYVGENAYLDMIETAKERVWFMTPYLLITEEMTRALALAASRGLDVRIITPGIPDKALVYRLTRSYYPPLVKAGVKIYEYTPGFIHAKACLRDDDAAIIGTINLDYRSLFLHFENGIFIHGGQALADIAQDFSATFTASRDVSQDDKYRHHGDRLTLGETLLRLVASML